ncbi:MAG: hypothetical protein LBE01_03575, partial [Deltaproteobacteria bacterium]|nr:hypothetical protein [Deltaproteobacteria bacterium]
MSNGRDWLLAPSAAPSRKNCLAFDLEAICREGDELAFALFWFLMRAANFVPDGWGRTRVGLLLKSDERRRAQIEKDLRAILAGNGEVSGLLEEMGQALHRAWPDLAKREILESALRFLFRLTFQAHFEDAHFNGGPALDPNANEAQIKEAMGEEDLKGDRAEGTNYQGEPPGWPGRRPTIRSLLSGLKPMAQSYVGWARLKALLAPPRDAQEESFYPLLSSALFDPQKTPSLDSPNLLNDEGLYAILNRLLRAKDGQKRDFAALSPFRLGAVYESLMEFEFRLAPRPMALAESRGPKRRSLGYYGLEEIESLKRNYIDRELVVLRELKPGELYLASLRNNRKAGGVYYTPDGLARPLATRGLARLAAGPFAKRSLLEAKLLDCACGTGNLLAESLDGLVWLARLKLKEDKRLAEALAFEAKALAKSRKERGYAGAEPVDELLALKRLFLRTAAHGVDRSALAVDLARAALTLDARVPGAAVPFVEPRLAQGDSLLGSGLADLEELCQTLGHVGWADHIRGQTNSLERAFLEARREGLFEEGEWKEAYNKIIRPTVQYLNFYFN